MMKTWQDLVCLFGFLAYPLNRGEINEPHELWVGSTVGYACLLAILEIYLTQHLHVDAACGIDILS